MSEEVWKDVVGYEGDYIVSNLGNVMSLNYGGVKGKKSVDKTANVFGWVLLRELKMQTCTST